VPSCASTTEGKSVWYAFTPSESGSVSTASASAWFSTLVAAYTGDSLTNLIEVGCSAWGKWLTFHVAAGTTYYFQARGVDNDGGPLQFFLGVAPPIVASFTFYPDDPTVFDTIQFYDWSSDPVGAGIQSWAWDFGDGSIATGCCPTTHRYAADGDYTVQLTVTTVDGRTASTSQTVTVRTHDVAVTRLSAPQAASAGQTRHISVGINSKWKLETVQVQLFKSIPGAFGGFELVGTLTHDVPVRPSNRTTDFNFSYTFTNEDANIRKVTFKAVATIINARDALPADNEAIASPTKVSKSK
jgi:PKD repeat protein